LCAGGKAACGETPLKAVVIGSTPHRLVHLTDTPVLVVRGRKP